MTGTLTLTGAQRRALQAVADGHVWKWTTGAWSRTPGAHPITLLWLLRQGLIQLEATPQPWRDARLTPEGREALS